MRPVEGSDPQSGGFTQRIINEARQLVLIFVYLWALFSLFAFHKSMVLASHSVLYDQSLAVVNALVFAKVMYFAERLRVGEVFEHKPLLWPVLVKSASFTVVLIAFYMLEEIAIGFAHGKTIAQSVPAGGQNALGMGAVAVIMFVVLIPFFAFKEISRILGPGELLRLFLTKSANQSSGRSPESPATGQDMARN